MKDLELKMNKIGFERYLEKNIKGGIIDFSIRASIRKLTPNIEQVSFYINPTGKDGETNDYVVVKDHLINTKY